MIAPEITLDYGDVQTSTAPRNGSSSKTHVATKPKLPADYAISLAALISSSVEDSSGTALAKFEEHVAGKEPVSTRLVQSEGVQAGSFAVDSDTAIRLLTEAKKTHPKLRETSSALQRLIRKTYLERILGSLESIQARAGDLAAAPHIERILKNIQTLAEALPYDSFTRVLLAFYDSLSYKNRWISYSAEQFRAAQDILTQADKRGILSYSGYKEAIAKLESTGFSTLPFELSFDSDEA